MILHWAAGLGFAQGSAGFGQLAQERRGGPALAVLLVPGLDLTVDLGDGQNPAPRVTGVVVNGGAAQRSLVTQIRIAFDQHVQFIGNPADAFQLVRQSDVAAIGCSMAR